ncbi:MAG: hypothetical protein J2P24_12310 [Streptosporangiales bacterium]|nr:hypothetical protein [Streptosporangiales bacterium]MBO0891878.1 hypothetical protein [Acidothermales bacterium]
MRHFVGLILGIILLPAFFALNWLVNHATAQAASTPSRTWMLAMLGTYAAFGLVLGVVIAARSISAVALLLGGILIIATEALLALPRLASIQMNIPQLYDHPEITRTWLPLIAGAALLFAAFMPTRWHRAHPEDEFDPLGMRGGDAFDEDARTTRVGAG